MDVCCFLRGLEDVERFVRLAGLAAKRALGIVAQLGDACRVAADRRRRQRRGRGLAQQAAADLMRNFGNMAGVVELHVDRHAIAAQRIVSSRRFGRGRELARAGLRLGERHDARLVDLVAHRKVLAACCTPASSASMSVLSL